MNKPRTPSVFQNAADRKRELQRIHPRWKDEWPVFITQLEKRLRQGHREYGDGSFARPAFALLAEVEEEILDQVNWAFITWTQLHGLRERVRLLEDKLDEVEMEELLAGGEDGG